MVTPSHYVRRYDGLTLANVNTAGQWSIVALNKGDYLQTWSPMQTRQATYSLGAEHMLATCSDEACDPDSENSTETIPSRELVSSLCMLQMLVGWRA